MNKIITKNIMSALANFPPSLVSNAIPLWGIPRSILLIFLVTVDCSVGQFIPLRYGVGYFSVLEIDITYDVLIREPFPKI